MAKYTRKPKKLDAAAEARLEPLVRRADEDARHYISALARIALVGTGAAASKRAKEGEDPMKILDAAFEAHCKAQCSFFRMMFAQLIEEGWFDFSLMDADAPGRSRVKAKAYRKWAKGEKSRP